MKLLQGDSLDVLATLDDESIDALVCDPPSGIAFMGKEWDKDKGGRDGWIDWLEEIMVQALRVLKPGAHALIWALPRTSHWTATALENSGFEIRDRLAHVFGSGFPKNHDVSKAIDKAAGAEREVVGISPRHGGGAKVFETQGGKGFRTNEQPDITVPATPDAKRWQGWGTALKPAVEDWWLCRKPLQGTIAANVLSHGTGALNIDESRIKHDEDCKMLAPQKDPGSEKLQQGGRRKDVLELKPNGRWPAHLILSHAPGCGDVCVEGCPILLMGEQSGEGGSVGGERGSGAFGAKGEGWKKREDHNDEGTAARYFLNLEHDPFLYCPKPGNEERNAGLAGEIGTIDDGRNTPIDNPYQRGETERRNVHPTVKPVDLMRWLCKLITPPGGTVLDPFMGSGTTGIAARLEGFDFLGIEREAEYIEIARARIEYAVKYDLRRGGKTKIDPRQMSMF